MTNKSEEKYPLLYLVVDKDVAASNNNRKFFERRTGITRGAQAVLEQWPGYLGTCWVSSLVSMVALISMFLLLMTALSTYRFHRVPRCVTGDNPLLDNSTIHLVHGPTPWDQPQLDMVEKVIRVFPNHRVHLVMIKKPFDVNETSNTGRKLMNAEESSSVDNDSVDGIFNWPFVDARDFIGALLKKDAKRNKTRRLTTRKPERASSIANLLLKYPQIFVEILTYEEVFEKSPLFYTWHYLNDETKLFAIRVLELWEYGGLSFDLSQAKNYAEAYPSTESILVTTDSVLNGTKDFKEPIELSEPSGAYADSLLLLGYSNFRMIPAGIVTLAENGCHMETKTPCHSFFGEVLVNLKYAARYTTPEDVIRSSLKFFVKTPRRGFRRT